MDENPENIESPAPQTDTANTPPPPRSRLRKWGLVLGVLLLLGGGTAGYFYYLMAGNVLPPRDKNVNIAIPERIKTTAELADFLAEEKIITNKLGFKLAAWWMGYEVKTGKCKLEKSHQSNKDLIHVLRRAKQTVDVTFHNIRTKEELAGRLARQLGRDSSQFIVLFSNTSVLAQYGVTDTTLLTLFIPDTYEVFANISAEDLLKRMAQESERFWGSEGRLEKAKQLNLTPQQVYTLASIVETETQYNPEKPTIAGVYLNRLRKGWKLEADPTVVFAVGDFSIRRVLNVHLQTESPYNTYLHTGLPPGPIYMASKASIDAVLSPETHEFMFFCAKPGGEGQHAFAKTLDGHNTNARLFQRWLNQQKIYK